MTIFYWRGSKIDVVSCYVLDEYEYDVWFGI